MRSILIVFGFMIIGLAALGHPGGAAGAGQHQADTATISVEIVADYIHSVIEAHRAFYTQAIERI